MPRKPSRGQFLETFLVSFPQHFGGVEPVNKQRLSSGGIWLARGRRVRQKVEGLQPSRVCEISGVSMRGQRYVGICRVRLCHVWDEVVEATVVGFPDGPNALQELLGMDRVVEWRLLDKHESKLHLQRERSQARIGQSLGKGLCSYNQACHLGHATFRAHDFTVCHGRWVLLDLGSPERTSRKVSKH